MPRLSPHHLHIGWTAARFGSARSTGRTTLDHTVWVDVDEHQTRFHASNGDQVYVMATVPSTLLANEQPWREIISDPKREVSFLASKAKRPPTNQLLDDIDDTTERIEITRTDGRVRLFYTVGPTNNDITVSAPIVDVEWPFQITGSLDAHETDPTVDFQIVDGQLLDKLRDLMGGQTLTLKAGTSEAVFHADHTQLPGVSVDGMMRTKVS